MRESLSVYLKGICMGAADGVPGVSGGTIALITGIYERLVMAITAVDVGAVRALASPHRPASRERLTDAVGELDLPFLVALGLGVVTGLLTVLQVVELALEQYVVATFAFFFGLIAAGSVVVYSEIDAVPPRAQVAGGAGFAFAFGIGFLREGLLPSTLPVLLVAGVVAASAMVLPGISGSLILLVLGQYQYLVDEVGAFLDGLLALLDGGTLNALYEPGTPLVVFAAGFGTGVVTIAHVIRWALATYRTATLTFLVGLMIGALQTPVSEIRAADPTWDAATIAVVVAAAVVGAALVFALDLLTDDIDY